MDTAVQLQRAPLLQRRPAAALQKVNLEEVDLPLEEVDLPLEEVDLPPAGLLHWDGWGRAAGVVRRRVKICV